MSHNPIISVIVPVYGVENYIEKCLLSIQQQTFKDFECIIVDDGSLDSSIKIGKIAVQNDDRFIFVSKPNGGLASARNFGLNLARGEYIAFIDSDDWVEPGFLELPYLKIKADNADICLFSLKYVDENHNIILILHNQLISYYKTEDFLVAKNTITQFACSKLYKKDIWKDICFDESIMTYEDVFVNFRLIYNRKLTNINEPLYNYLQRPGSLSKAIHPTYLQDRIAIKNKQIEFAKEQGLYEKHKDYIVYTYLKTFVFYCSTHFARYSKNYNNDIQQLKIEIDPNIFTLKNIILITKREPKVGLSLLLFKISPKAFRYFVQFWFRNAIA